MDHLIGLVAAAVLALVLSLGLKTYEKSGNERLLAATVAGQQVQFNKGVESYVRAHKTDLQAAASATVPAVITVALVKAEPGDLLPASFNEVNAVGQTWQAQALEPISGSLQVLTYGIGGDSLDDRFTARIAGIIGNAGGIIPKNDSGAYPAGAATAMGTSGGWSLSTTGYLGALGGRSVTLLNFTDGQLTSNYLYRNAVPGQPQLNQMNTALGMNSNAISNAGAITAASLQTTGNTTIGGNASVTGTIVTPQKITGGSQLLTNIAAQNTGCSILGDEVRDSSGAALFCVNYVWKKAGGGITDYRDFDWFPGYGTFGTGLLYTEWTCSLSMVGGKYAGGGEQIQVYRDGGSGTWVVSGSSSSDNSGAFARIGCSKLAA